MERVEVPGWSHIIGMPVKLDESLAVKARAAPVCVGPTICQRSWALLVSASNTTGVGSVTVKPKRSTPPARPIVPVAASPNTTRSEEHTSELQSLMRISYAVFCLKKKNKHQRTPNKR